MKLFYAAFIGCIVLIWIGVFDPRPLGRLTESTTIPADTPFTARTIGTSLQIKSAAPTTIAIDPTGYLAIWQLREGEREWLRRWQTWPHVRESENEIWVDWESDKLSVWINREILWEEWPLKLHCPCSIEGAGKTTELFLP